MSDVETLFQINAEIRDDPNRPSLTREVNVNDVVDVEIALYEADDLVDRYTEKYRSRFIDPEMFETLKSVYRVKFRRSIKEFLYLAKDFMDNAGVDNEDEEESPE